MVLHGAFGGFEELDGTAAAGLGCAHVFHNEGLSRCPKYRTKPLKPTGNPGIFR